jgi:proliferating cell nuclear antigen
MKMDIKLDNPSLLSRVVEIISEIVTEVRIKVGEDGMSVTAMDPANVSMVNFKISKSAFSRFESESGVLGINLENLKQILRRCGSGSSLMFEREENLLKIHIQDRVRRKFTLNLISVDSEEINFGEKMSNMGFSSSVEISSGDLVDSIEDCAVVADACSFIIENGKFVIEAKSLNSSRVEFSENEAKISAESCRAKYSLEYLQKFMKGAKLCEKTVVHFAEDHPLKLDFKGKDFELNFVLAPRIENED